MAYSDSVVSAESGGNPNATNAGSSASGAAGFTNGTWLDTIKAARPDLAGQSDEALLALKTDPALSAQMADAYGNANCAILAKNGLPVTDGTKYLAHFAGPGGAVKVLQADPNASVADILGPSVIKANPFLSGMTAQGLQAWAAKKMGAEAPQPGIQNNAPASPAGPPVSLAPPPQVPPIFAPQQAPQEAPAPQQAFQPPPTMQPIFTPPRKPIDLSMLRAQLSRAPIFPQG